jgi:hypothetical protein
LIIKYFEGKFSQYKITKTGEKLSIRTGIAFFQKLRVKLRKKVKSDATLIIIPGMNHVMKEAPADKDQNLATYSKPDLPLKLELVPDIVGFVNKL